MTARVSLRCDGQEGVYPCRQAVPVGEVLTGAEARHEAKKHFGWSNEIVAERINDFCPRCTRERAEKKVH
jgi:hypothetical protein